MCVCWGCRKGGEGSGQEGGKETESKLFLLNYGIYVSQDLEE